MTNNESAKTVSYALVLCVVIASMAYVAHDEGAVTRYPVYQPVYMPVYLPTAESLSEAVIGPSLAEGISTVDLVKNEGAFSIDSSDIVKFISFADFKEYVGDLGADYGGRYEMDSLSLNGSPTPMMGADSGSALSFTTAGGGSGTPHSTTNIQIAGVDEGDMLKNDGEYAYLVAQDSSAVQIMRVYPAENAGILSRLEFEGQVLELYLHGARLIVIEQAYHYEEGYGRSSYMNSNDPITMVHVFDVSNRSAPKFERCVRMSGQFTTSRQMGDYLYVIGGYSLYNIKNESELPVPADDIYHLEDEDTSYMLTQFMTMKINGAHPEPKILSIVMGNSKNVLVTHQNIYITYTKSYASGAYWSSSETQRTVIHRLSITGGDMAYAARGEVEGTVLNQYSLDEHGGYLRIATNTPHYQKNQLYVLDDNLCQVGKIEDIAPGERIYSCRFMEDKAYIVTFKKVDPLFVIDLADPEAPKILGQLKIPGYSDYLHPYDENHIIGVGKDTVDADGGNFAWYQGVKISFFDVSDFEHPVELDKMVIGERGSESLALQDPHAFLFDSERKLLILPMQVYESGSSYQSGYGNNWYGAYIFNIAPENGIVLAGKVSHNVEAERQSGYDYDCNYNYNAYNPVKRSFYIGDVIYTVSGKMLIGSSYPDFGEVCQLDFDS